MQHTLSWTFRSIHSYCNPDIGGKNVRILIYQFIAREAQRRSRLYNGNFAYYWSQPWKYQKPHADSFPTISKIDMKLTYTFNYEGTLGISWWWIFAQGLKRQVIAIGVIMNQFTAKKMLDAGVGLHPGEEHAENEGQFLLVFSQEQQILAEGRRWYVNSLMERQSKSPLIWAR